MQKTRFLIAILNCVLLLSCNSKFEKPTVFNEISQIDTLNSFNIDSTSKDISQTVLNTKTKNFDKKNILFLDFHYGMDKNEVNELVNKKTNDNSLIKDNNNEVYYNIFLNNLKYKSKLSFIYDKNQTLESILIDIPIVNSEYFPSDIKFVNDNKLFSNYVKNNEERLNDIIVLYSLKYQKPTKKIKSKEEDIYPGDIFVLQHRFDGNFIKPKNLDNFYEFKKNNLNIKIINSIYVIQIQYSLNSVNERIEKQKKTIEKQNTEKTLNEI